jgi:hypothetical protein
MQTSAIRVKGLHASRGERRSVLHAGLGVAAEVLRDVAEQVGAPRQFPFPEVGQGTAGEQLLPGAMKPSTS